jgi:3-deoxy-D-manno-octulosonic-acid transferase
MMAALARALYSLLMVAAQPLLRRKLAQRALAEPGYAQAVPERFGHYEGLVAGQGAPGLVRPVWVHAVSLGETRAAAVLVARLREAFPGHSLLLTHGTATGRAEGVRLLQPGDVQVWQPWDTPGAVSRFLARFQPVVGVLMETEVWPNLAAGCRAHGIPLVLANARLSEHSLRRARRLAWLARPAFGSLAAVLAQTEADAGRLRQLGAPIQGVMGNLKFDASPDATLLAQGHAWRAKLTRPVVMLASSREGEEVALLALLRQLHDQNRPPALANAAQGAIKAIASPRADQVHWLIVPRHPQRFDEVAALAAQQGFTVQRRSGWTHEGPDGDATDSPQPVVWLGDSLGEMPLYYGLASAALLGGSFEALGGQNLIEAAACGCPVVMGPHTFNFAEAADMAQVAGAAARVPGWTEGVELAMALVTDAHRQAAVAELAQAFAQAHRGACDRTVQAIRGLVSPGAPTAGAAAPAGESRPA